VQYVGKAGLAAGIRVFAYYGENMSKHARGVIRRIGHTPEYVWVFPLPGISDDALIFAEAVLIKLLSPKGNGTHRKPWGNRDEYEAKISRFVPALVNGDVKEVSGLFRGLHFCTCCGDALPVTTEHFSRDEGRTSGFKASCKGCRAKHQHKEKALRRARTPEEVEEKRREMGDKPCPTCTEVLPRTTEHFNCSDTAIDGLDYECRGCCAVRRAKLKAEEPEKYRVRCDKKSARRRAKLKANNRTLPLFDQDAA